MKFDFSISVPANTTLNDILDTARISKLPIGQAMAYQIRMYTTGSALGLQHELFVGSDNPLERGIVNAQNRLPVVPDDYAIDTFGDPGEKLQLNVVNTTGVALTYFLSLFVTPV